MLQFGHQPDRTAPGARFRRDEIDDLRPGRDVEPTIISGIGGSHRRHPLAGAQGLQLGEGEVLGEPADLFLAVDRLFGVAPGKFGMGGHIGRLGDIVLVPRDQHAVTCRHEIGFDIIRAVEDRLRIGRKRVFGPQAQAPRCPITTGLRRASCAWTGQAADTSPAPPSASSARRSRPAACIRNGLQR